MKLNLTLSPRELLECHRIPDVLRALADYHAYRITYAEVIGAYEPYANFHAERAAQLRAEADRIEAEI